MKLQRKILKAPEFVGLRWINSSPISIESLIGQVVLVNFWDFSCINCIRTIPYLKIWHGRYADRGFTIIGIHASEFSFAQSEKRVLKEVDFHGLFYPVAIDNDFSTWRRYSNRFWPAMYLIDKDGYLADYHFGEGGYTTTEQAIQELLREMNPRIILPKVLEPLRPEDSDDAKLQPVTPEIYFGFRKGRLGNSEGFDPMNLIDYKRPLGLMSDIGYAIGKWENLPECLQFSGSGNGEILAVFEAASVYAVMGNGSDKICEFSVFLDDKPVNLFEGTDREPSNTLSISSYRAYPLVKSCSFGKHTLRITTSSKGLRIYSLTFLPAPENLITI